MAIFENTHINNWYDYILLKFADQNYFEIESNQENLVLIKSITNRTKIYFYFSNNDDQMLNDCQYSNDTCRGWSGETIAINSEFGIFNQENLDSIDKILRPAIYNGWISIDYFFMGRFYKSVSYDNKQKTGTPFVQMGSLGCLIIPLFPLFALTNYLLRKEIIGQKNEIIINPIISILNTN